MKGPRSRTRHNVWRVWECRRCQRRVFALPQVTSRVCLCQGEAAPTWMTLLEAPPRKKTTATP